MAWYIGNHRDKFTFTFALHLKILQFSELSEQKAIRISYPVLLDH